MSEDVPAWFENEIIDGITMLYALSLPGQPSHETVVFTQRTWTKHLWRNRLWQKETDVERLRIAFQRLSVNVDRWPAPRQLLDCMPARPEPKPLPKTPMSERNRKEASRKFRELADALAKGRKVTP